MRSSTPVNSAAASVSLIAVRAGLMSPTLRFCVHRFIEARRRATITFGVFHILGPPSPSLDDIADPAAYLGDAKISW